MILVIAFCAKDKAIAIRQAQWIAELGGTERHDCLLGYHQDTTPDEVAEILTPHFNHLGGFKIVEDATTYPEIANMMWKACANKIADEFNEPWLWIEPDGVPMAPDWLDKIENEYKACGKPLMLDKVVTPTSVHNSGTGVYPGRVRDYTQNLWRLAGQPWDVFLAPEFTPNTHHTTLIQDKFYRVWDDPKSGEPTFPDAESLSIIESSAVVFHRNKDGSLIERLREKNLIARLGPIEIESSKTRMDLASLTQCASRFNDLLPDSAVHTLSERMRFHCAELASLVEDKPGRKAQLHTELRKVGLMAKAKARK